VPDRRPNDDGGSKLSPQTLIIASLASLTAAIVTSTFWQRGTPITAALTPVIVAIASELYSRPARRITEFSSRANQVRSRRFAAEELHARERVPTGAPRDRRRPDALQPPEDESLGPVRIYRSGADRPSPVRRLHIRVALATAAIAFVIAALVLTLPELVLGGSVASHGRTTFFGGSGHRHRTSPKHESTSTALTTSTPTTSAPTQTAPTVTAPPAQTTPGTTGPTQQLPQSGQPAPSPSPSATTPAQTPPGQ
jgi:hypothetical protein